MVSSHIIFLQKLLLTQSYRHLPQPVFRAHVVVVVEKLVPAQVLAAHRARDRRQRSIQALSASPGIVRITLGDTHAGAAPSAPLPTRRATSQTPIVDRREMLSRILLVSQPAPSRSAVVQPPVPTRRSSNIDINIPTPPSHTRHLLLLHGFLIP